jgi:hypothetical protein
MIHSHLRGGNIIEHDGIMLAARIDTGIRGPLDLAQ